MQQQQHCCRSQNVFRQQSSNPFLKATLMLLKLGIKTIAPSFPGSCTRLKVLRPDYLTDSFSVVCWCCACCSNGIVAGEPASRKPHGARTCSFRCAFRFFLLELVPNPIRSIDYWTGRCQDNEDNYCYCCQRSWVIAVGRGCSKMQARTKNYSNEGDSSTEVIIFHSTKK